MAAQPFLAGGSSGFPWPIRLAHSWRLHSHHPAPLRAFVDFANTNAGWFDAVLISGDLATSGDRHDLTAAYELCTAPAAPGSMSWTNGGEPTLVHWLRKDRLDVLPGNHDRFLSAARLFRPGNRAFDRVFSPKPPKKQLWSARQGVAHGVAIRRGAWVVHVVKADFTLQARDGGKRFYAIPGWLGQGRVNPIVLNQLAGATRQIQQDIRNKGWKPVTLWAIHFDPYCSDQTLALLDSEMLARQAAGLDVPAILCGHTHETKVKPLSSKTWVFACGSTAHAEAPHWDCQAIEIHTDDAGLSKPVVFPRWYRFIKGQFLPMPPP
jgi:hypothetical protein